MWCGTVWCGEVQCGVVQCGVVQCSVVQCGVVQCGVVQCGAVQCGAVQCGAVWCGAVWCGVVCGAVWCGVVWYRALRAKHWFIFLSQSLKQHKQHKVARLPQRSTVCVGGYPVAVRISTSGGNMKSRFTIANSSCSSLFPTSCVIDLVCP